MQLAEQLAPYEFDTIFSSPCLSARATAALLAEPRMVRVKVVEELRNVDHGLWHGKRIDEVKQHQPRVFRQGQEQGESICPPGGESIACGRERAQAWLARLLRKQRQGTICCVVPEPLASILACEIEHSPLADLWEAELDNAHWQCFEVATGSSVSRLVATRLHASHELTELRETRGVRVLS
jgi:probable phosphoglycerate mutase